MPAFIRLDLFPATVTRADGDKFDPCRAVVTDDSVYVFMDANPRPTEVFTARLDDYETVSRRSYRVVTDDGEELLLEKRNGCGCGNKLRGFRAFPGVPLVKN